MLEAIKDFFKTDKVRLYIAIALVVILAIVLGVREYQHYKTEHSLKSQLETTEASQAQVKLLNDNSVIPTPAQISGAGDLSSNMANDFAKQVAAKEKSIENGKSTDQYVYTVNGDADTAYAQFQQSVTNGTAPKEVKQADFVTASKSDDGTTTVANKDGTTQTVQQSTVRINSYYNYEPSIYYMPQGYPDGLKRHDLIYTNRDTMIDVNYDADRKSGGMGKVGVSVGVRIAKW